MDNIQAAALCTLDGAVLICKATLCTDTTLAFADSAVQRHIVIPAFAPHLCSLCGDQAGINAPGLKELLLELIQPFRDFLKLRVLGFQL